jgi:hypothetical protein
MQIAVDIYWEVGYAMYDNGDPITSFYLIQEPGEWVKLMERNEDTDEIVRPVMWVNKSAIRRITVVE